MHSPEQETPLYLISLIDHKSQVDYNVSIQLLRYMVCIWNEYGKEMEGERGEARNKSFRYPPVLPIVYYEGKEPWTADVHLQDRIQMNDLFPRARAKAEQAETKAEEAEAKAEQAEINAKQAELRKAQMQTEAMENTIKTLVSVYQSLGASPEQTMIQLMEKCGLDRETAEQKMAMYLEDNIITNF